MNAKALYEMRDQDGDVHSIYALNEDDARIQLLRMLPPGCTIEEIISVTPMAAPQKRDPATVKGPGRPGPGGTRIVGKRKAAGRNDPCPCGSGRKTKYCCARRPQV